MIPKHIAKSKSYLIGYCFVTFYIPDENKLRLKCLIKGLIIKKDYKVNDYETKNKTLLQLYHHDERIRAIVFFNKTIDDLNGNVDWDWEMEYEKRKKFIYGKLPRT